jgi:hypothetical protein
MDRAHSSHGRGVIYVWKFSRKKVRTFKDACINGRIVAGESYVFLCTRS